MAEDWIKMRTDLYRDPKVILIADELLATKGPMAGISRSVMRNAVVGALVSVWGVSRQRGKRCRNDLTLPNASLPMVDYIADLTGFGEALLAVGWVQVTHKALIFPRFFESHNVDPRDVAKEKNRDRQRKYRERHRNDSRDTTVTHRGEERRVE